MPLFDWFAVPELDESHVFKLLEVTEASVFDDAIKARVSAELIRARVNDQLHAELLRQVHKPKYRAMLAAATPNRSTTRKGDFGEIVAAALLDSHLGYIVPVKKLRYKVRANDQQTGIDVVAFRKSADNSAITEICYVESKFRSGPDKQIAVSAHHQLKGSVDSDLGEIHLFLANALCDQNDPLSVLFLKYLASDEASPDSFCLALHADTLTWDSEAIDNLAAVDTLLDPLMILLFKVANISEVVRKCFAHAGIQLNDDDD